MSECALDDRSARGYCPGEEEGHADEITGTEDLYEATTTTVSVPDPIELPYTGVDSTFGMVGGLTLLLGAVLVKAAGRSARRAAACR
jgi:hypothetical protein